MRKSLDNDASVSKEALAFTFMKYNKTHKNNGKYSNTKIK